MLTQLKGSSEWLNLVNSCYVWVIDSLYMYNWLQYSRCSNLHYIAKSGRLNEYFPWICFNCQAGWRGSLHRVPGSQRKWCSLVSLCDNEKLYLDKWGLTCLDKRWYLNNSAKTQLMIYMNMHSDMNYTERLLMHEVFTCSSSRSPEAHGTVHQLAFRWQVSPTQFIMDCMYRCYLSPSRLTTHCLCGFSKGLLCFLWLQQPTQYACTHPSVYIGESIIVIVNELYLSW